MAKYNERSGKKADNVEADTIFDLIAHVLYGLIVGGAIGLYFGNITLGLTIGEGIMISLGIINTLISRKKKR